MNKTFITIFFLFTSNLLVAQTQSDYYKAPFDTIFQSKALNENKKLTVILPRSFSTSKASKFPLMIVFDRQNKNIFRQVFESINYLVTFNEIPESIIIGISSDANKRNNETLLSTQRESGYGEKTDSFIFKELIPFLETAYNTDSCNILIGHSRYGYFTSYLLAKHLDKITAVVACSPFYKELNVNIIDTLKNNLATTKLDHHIYYRFITGDSLTDTNDFIDMKSFLSKTTPPKHFNWKGEAYYNANHMATPGVGVTPSLLEIFDFWSDEMKKVLSDPKREFNQKEYDIFLQKMKKHYGSPIGLGLPNLNGIGYKYYNQKNYSLARQAWNITLKEYPMFTDALISIANTYRKENDKSNALKYFEKAKQNLVTNSFYSDVEKKELLNEIEETLSTLK